MMINEDILEGLNPAQREAVVNYNGPSLIIAGAGSGKTRVLTTRIAWMLAQGVSPNSILALTFTNKAAREMRERIEKLVGAQARYIRMGTFHSVFARILRENAAKLGYPESYTIYEPTDVKNLVKTIVKEMNLSEERYKPQAVAARISMAKNSLVTPAAYRANAVLVGEDREAKMPELVDIYAEYCNRCKRNGAMDFDDLLLQTNILLRDAPEVLEQYQHQFKYILVDEYQDTNMAQYIIVRRLALLHSNVCVVGDDAQSIYAFRGAKIENILSFQRDYPTTKVYKLEQNYRSTQTIVEAANSLIAHNSRRLEKRCFSAADRGEKIKLVRVVEDSYEPVEVAMDIKDRAREGA
ncbi:MAG: UvrD-helicase domain-containing protein, partial [Alistipes sp.]|nr:UvrD-helicase domain-containing protein [Alistipes sp.]